MRYLLDANVFIQARNMHYGFDFCPGFWDWLAQANVSGRVFSLDVVADELADPDLAEWARQRGKAFFLPRDAASLGALARVQAWTVDRKHYSAAALSQFNQAADSFLIAYALAHGCTLVTNEVPAPGSVKRVKIPDVCIGLGVECITPHALLRREQVRLVLGTTP